ncbi:transcriptional regulator [Duganella sp. Leaf126]|uniref:sugar diacid recognition domain-containing protein n=1 Tax=Duganella sp. Leaf126 TaxID=1736266 RepID=UPI0006FC19A1|nr:sugar diacid recognition domain-containing protein [Duganella sp. Leaf126]KQQ32432.1 transcriptional regulator [Duganella sp. Leaf126]
MNLLNSALAQDIVTRTMQIIPYNVNVMDAHGSIVASGNAARIGELHTGAMLALAKQLPVEIDSASARNMHGAQPGINLPLTVNGQVCGAIGLSGAPDDVRQFGALVRLTAEMILEQAQLTDALQRDTRYRETFVLQLIAGDPAARAGLGAWARRLGADFSRPHAVLLLELDAHAAGTVEAFGQLQRLQLRLLARLPAALTAASSSHELVIIDFFDGNASADPAAWTRRKLDSVAALLEEEGAPSFALTAGIVLTGLDQVAISYQSARTAARIAARSLARNLARSPATDPMSKSANQLASEATSKPATNSAARPVANLFDSSAAAAAQVAPAGAGRPQAAQGQHQGGRRHSYYEQALPVLLSGLDAGWQAEQLRQPMARLRAQENRQGPLQRTLDAWFRHDNHLAATAQALHIHRNTLDYRLRRIGDITGLDLARLEDRFLLYVSLLLADGSS